MRGREAMDKKELYDRLVISDVLVVGGAGAAATAAVAAARGGARVIMAVKGALGNSGNTIMAGAGISMDGVSAKEYGEAGADPNHTTDVMFEEIVKESFYLSDQDVVEQYVNYCGRSVHELIEWGKRAGQSFFFLPPSEYITSGKALGIACKQGVKETPGIEVMNDVMVQDILVKDGRVIGAMGVDIYSGKLIVFKTKAVILGTGGYQPCSFKCTVSDMTGDGMAMAYRAGAKLADMEFQLFAPGILISPRIHRGSIFAGFIFLVWTGKEWPQVINADGEHVENKMPEKLLNLARTSESVKLIYTYHWGREIASGKATSNKGLYCDLFSMGEDNFEQGTAGFMSICEGWYKKKWHYQGGDFTDLKEMLAKKIPWEIGISNEYSMGGIVVDGEMRTGVPGLFACGEVTSGVFGASRVADATTEMVVQGFKAGESAAEYSKNMSEPQLDDECVAQAMRRILRPFEKDDGIEPIKVRLAIEKTADEGFGYLRDEAGLSATLKEIERIRTEDLSRMHVKSRSRPYNYEWIEALQVENLLTCTEVGVRAALMRKESRGFHIRSDYPEVDHDNFLVKIEAHDSNGKMKITTRKPTVTKLEPPVGKVQGIMQYLMDYEGENA
jgi:succinate dehydrogenase / fumarate reductase flavoprotein subunit